MAQCRSCLECATNSSLQKCFLTSSCAEKAFMSPSNRTISGLRLVCFQFCSGDHIAKRANCFDKNIGDKNIARSIVAVFMFLSPIFCLNAFWLSRTTSTPGEQKSTQSEISRMPRFAICRAAQVLTAGLDIAACRDLRKCRLPKSAGVGNGTSRGSALRRKSFPAESTYFWRGSCLAALVMGRSSKAASCKVTSRTHPLPTRSRP